ncbi:MAG: prepilin-type N-terminal cleavage/methylation domain-containing protein [Planctomycetota bacterium]
MHTARLQRSGNGARQGGFTLVELIVVMAIIGLLASVLLVAGRTLIDKSKASKTSATLNIVNNAIDEFSSEQQASATLTRSSAYRQRYGTFPPDELEVFISGVPTTNTNRSLAPGNGTVMLQPGSTVTLEPMTGQISGFTSDQERALGNRDIAAMLLAIDLFSEAAQVMIDKLPSDTLITPVRSDGSPLLFLDRNENQTFDAIEDQPLKYLVDDWGTPMSYLAQRDFSIAGSSTSTESSNHPKWNEASTWMVRLNGSRPVLFSYGPQGPDQLIPEFIAAGSVPDPDARAATVVDDWANNNLIDSPLNGDNIYPDETLREKLSRGSR